MSFLITHFSQTNSTRCSIVSFQSIMILPLFQKVKCHYKLRRVAFYSLPLKITLLSICVKKVQLQEITGPNYHYNYYQICIFLTGKDVVQKMTHPKKKKKTRNGIQLDYISLFNIYLLCAYYVLDTGRGTVDTYATEKYT